MITAKPKRRFLRYSLRTMLVVVLVLSVWLGYHANRAARQRESVEAIVQRRGFVGYGYRYPIKDLERSDPNTSPSAPAWLRNLVGDDFFTHVVKVSMIVYGDFGDDDVPFLNDFKSLRWLHLTGTRITDAGLQRLGPLPELRLLTLGDTAITDEGLRHVAKFIELRILNVEATMVTDNGLADLGHLSNLKTINLSHTQITDDGIEHLKSLSSLKKLVIKDTLISEDGVASLRNALPNAYISWSPQGKAGSSP